MTGKSDFEALSRRIEALEAKVGGARGQTVLPYLVDYSNDLGNSVAGNDRIVPLLKRLEELETFLDPLYAEKEVSSLGVKMSLVESQHNTVKENQELLGGYRLQIQPVVYWLNHPLNSLVAALHRWMSWVRFPY